MKRIECSVVRDILPLYLDDVVSAETRDIVKEHLAECPECREKAWVMKEELQLPILVEQQKQEARVLRQQRWKNVPWKRVVPILVLAALTVICLMALPSKGERLFYQFQADERLYFFGHEILYRGPNCPHDPACGLHYADDFSQEEQDRIFVALDGLTYMGVTEPKSLFWGEDELYEVRLIFRGDRYDIRLMENGRNHYLYVTSEDMYLEVGNYEPLLTVLEEIFRNHVTADSAT